jgi:adenine-specific DNA-methyltransferase
MSASRSTESRTEAKADLDSLVNTIHKGDCFDLLRRLPSGSVAAVVSSPPYNLGKEYETRRALDVYVEEQRDVLAECVRALKDGGSIFWQVGSYSDRGVIIPLDVRLFPVLEQLGMTPRNRIAWVRPHGLHASKKFSCRYETILWFTKGEKYLFDLDAIRVPQKYPNKRAWRGDKQGQLTCNPAGKNPGDVWAFRNVKHNHEEQTTHPCQFPEDLVRRVVLASTLEGDLVLDPYMGAGTVAVVARDLRRGFVGAETDHGYHDLCLRRLRGEPDANGVFPNLKTLRDYAERTGTSVAQYRFEVQVGGVPTERAKAKIFPEEAHLDELHRRLDFEETFTGDNRERLPTPQSGKVPSARRGRRKVSEGARSKGESGLLWDEAAQSGESRAAR